MERPTKVEVGQRWRYGDEPPFVDYTIVSVDGRLRMQWDTGGLSITEPVDATVRGDVFLGYAPGFGTPTPVAGGGRPVPAKGQRWRDTGTTDFPVKGVFTLDRPSFLPGSWWIEPGIGRNWVTADWFTSGRLEFVDHGTLTPAPTGVPAPVVTPATDAQRRDYAREIMERHTPDGTPLSALEAIQAKKPPEPWRPSVDEYDLLPDAGTSWSDTRGSGRP